MKTKQQGRHLAEATIAVAVEGLEDPTDLLPSQFLVFHDLLEPMQI